MADTYSIDEPSDLIANCMNEEIYIKCRNNTELKGKLIAFDNHLNMILQDAEEIVTVVENGENKQNKRKMPMLCMRGDGIILVSPISKGIL